MMMSRRFTGTIRRAGLTGLAAAVALLVVGEQAAARARLLPFDQVDQDAEPLAPAQRDQMFPSQRGGGISLAQATQMAQSRYQGRVVRAEAVQMGERVVYEIRILGDDNRVRTVRIDAQTGSFL
jgi:uncharacterized membrane protein YkoI